MIDFTHGSHDGNGMLNVEKMEFPRMCRDLRVAAGMKVKQVCELLNMSSYANVEYNNYKTIRLERVHALARIHGLDQSDTARFVAAWEALPTSPYNQHMAPTRAKRDAQRSKAKALPAVWRAAVESFGLLVGVMFDEQWPPEKCAAMCSCPQKDGAQALRCPFCNTLEALGMPEGWTDLDTVIAKLAEHQSKMDDAEAHVTGLEE